MDVDELLWAYYVWFGKPFGRYLTVLRGVVALGSVLFPGIDLTPDAAGLGFALSGTGSLSDPHQRIQDRYGPFERQFWGDEGLDTPRRRWSVAAVSLGRTLLGLGLLLALFFETAG